jgi:hypothetical protein
MRLTSNAPPPQWNLAIPAARRYAEAGKRAKQ